MRKPEETKEESMKKKRFMIRLLVLSFSAWCLISCAGDTEMPQTEKAKKSEEEVKKEAEEIQQERREISIAFPFYGNHEKDKLTLAAPGEGQDEYELIYYDGDGQVLQQIPCGRLTEPVTFSYDGLAYGTWDNLEIFSDGSDTGLLFIWKNDRFSTEPIKIPRYVEARSTAMLTSAEDEKLCEKQIYLLNEDKNRVEKARSFRFQKDTATLVIWDELENQSLFDGTVRLDENGNPLNEEYFDRLLWSDLPLLWDYGEEDTVKTWVEEKPEEKEEIEIDSFEDMQYYFYGNSGDTQQYDSRKALLEDFGFENSEPVYQYFDRYGNLQLELYADEDREQMCGIAYIYRFNTELEKVVSMKGFTLCTIMEAEWNERDPFILQSVYGTSGTDYEHVKDYEESIEYTDTGKPDCFVARGRIEQRPEADKMQDILKIDYIYREDDSLFWRDYYHNDWVFGTTLQSLDSFYDEQERVIFESGYITHGTLEYYYIYEDRDGKTADKPAYVLCIDYNMGYVIPNMIK